MWKESSAVDCRNLSSNCRRPVALSREVLVKLLDVTTLESLHINFAVDSIWSKGSFLILLCGSVLGSLGIYLFLFGENTKLSLTKKTTRIRIIMESIANLRPSKKKIAEASGNSMSPRVRSIDGFQIMQLIIKLCKSRLIRQIYDVISLYCNAILRLKKNHFNKKLIFYFFLGTLLPASFCTFLLFYFIFFSFVLFPSFYWTRW